MSDPAIVVIGAGQAGGWAARTLRDEGFEGGIVVIGEEPYPPYERPPLSKEVLLGKEPADSSYLWPEGSFDELGIELRTGVAATAIDRAARTVALSDGGSIPYRKLLIATGGRVRRLPVEGAELDGVHYLRGIDDSEAIRGDLGEGRDWWSSAAAGSASKWRLPRACWAPRSLWWKRWTGFAGGR